MGMAKLVQVIVTTERRGLGTIEEPYYRATQYWSVEGDLLWEAPEPEEP